MLSRACFVTELLLSSGLAGCRRCSRSKLCLQARGRTLSSGVPSTCHRPFARQLRSCHATSRQPLHTSAAQMEAQAPVDTCAADNQLLSVRSHAHKCLGTAKTLCLYFTGDISGAKETLDADRKVAAVPSLITSCSWD